MMTMQQWYRGLKQERGWSVPEIKCMLWCNEPFLMSTGEQYAVVEKEWEQADELWWATQVEKSGSEWLTE